MEQLKALRRRKVQLTLEGGEGTQAVLTLTGLSIADLDKVAQRREDHPVSQGNLSAMADEALFVVWLAALAEHPEVTLDDLRGAITADMFPKISEAVEGLMPQSTETGALECPACGHRFPFRRTGSSVEVRTDVANYVPPSRTS